jgi:hypothetical protein
LHFLRGLLSLKITDSIMFTFRSRREYIVLRNFNCCTCLPVFTLSRISVCVCVCVCVKMFTFQLFITWVAVT